MTDLYSIRDAMLAMTPEDRENLRAMLDLAEQRTPVESTREEDMLWEVLQRMTIGPRHFRSLSAFLRDKRHGVNRVDYSDAVRSVFDLILAVKPVRRPTVDQVALLDVLFECLVKDMSQRRIEVNPRTMIEAVPRLRVAVENCYPGYVAAGMLDRLIRVAA